MTKKEKKDKAKVTMVTTKTGESFRVFDILQDFEAFLKNGKEDDEFENIHCQLKYYPPFIIKEAHDNPDKIKDTANSNSKKYVRHLHQHVEKHLLKDIKAALDFPDLNFKDKSKEKTFEKIVWHYNDQIEQDERKFKIAVAVTCKHDNALVEVDYKTEQIEEPII